MAITSHTLAYSAADKAHVLAYLGSKGNLNADQRRRLDGMRKAAQAAQDDLDRQGVDRGLSVPDAPDHLIAGRTDSDALCAGNAYNCAVQHIVLDRMAADFRYDVQELIDNLETEHNEWEYATKNIGWYTQDTLFFNLT
ncbi:hypothetical protein [Streptomyces sp. NPDC007264]|uniref:DUF7691 family protein n=1 Tax=Streptomyces sp. NPDC007264 TaxID=3364777 RepID=UPI0036DA551E